MQVLELLLPGVRTKDHFSTRYASKGCLDIKPTLPSRHEPIILESLGFAASGNAILERG